MRRALIPVLCLLLLPVVACGPSDYEKVAKGIHAIELGIQALQNVVVDGNLRGWIDTADARAIFKACDRIDDATEQASGLIRQLKKLQDEDRVDLFQVLHPVLETVDAAMNMELFGIKDPALKKKIKVAIGAMQLTLRAVELTLVKGEENGKDQT